MAHPQTNSNNLSSNIPLTIVRSKDDELILHELDNILASHRFSASPKLSNFLRYIVVETLESRDCNISAYSIAVNAFERPSNFDPQSDPIVRIQAGRMRRAIENYYLSKSNNSLIRISVPKGSYVPNFIPTDPAGATPHSSPPLQEEQIGSKTIPSLAVVLFESASEEKSHFATGISRQLLIDLSRFNNLTVVGPIDSNKLSPPANCPTQIGEQLGVRFILQGCVQHQGNQIRITVNLTDSFTKASVWGRSYDRNLSTSDIFQLQDEISRRCAAFIAGDLGIISTALHPAAKVKKPTERDAYEAALLAYHSGIVLTEDSMLQAREALESSILTTPNNALTKALLADLYCIEYFSMQGADTALLLQAETLAKEALKLDRKCQDARWVRGQVHFFKGEMALCKRELNAAIALNPNNPPVLAACGFYFPMLNMWDEALEHSLRAIRLNPQHPSWYNFTPALYYFINNDTEKSIYFAELLNVPELFWGPLLRSAIFSNAGRNTEARKEAQRLLILRPDFPKNGRQSITRLLVQDKIANRLITEIEKLGIDLL